MSLSTGQFQTIINGVRSICDELLGNQDPTTKTAPAAPGAAPATSMPGAGAPNPAPAPPAETGAGAPPAPKTGADPVITGSGAPDPVETNQEDGYVGPEGAVELDPEGIPWDARIHTVKKAKLKSGVWRLKPGSDAKVVAQVKTELVQKVATYQAGLTPEKIADTLENTPGAAEPGAAEPGAAEPGETITQGVPPAEDGSEQTWSELLNKIVAAQITSDTVVNACVLCGVENFAALQKAPKKIKDVAKVLGV